MQDATSLPQDLAACQQLIAQLSAQLQERDAQLEDRDTQLRDRQALLDEQAQTVVAIGQAREDLQQENETLQLTIDKLLRQLYGNRRERVIDDPHQQLLDFGDDPQAADMFQDAMEEAEQIVEDVTNRRKAKRRRRRREKFPEHLPRVEKFIDVSEEEKLCPTHGERKLIGYDETETLKMKRPELSAWAK
jgi:hypothetical protein